MTELEEAVRAGPERTIDKLLTGAPDAVSRNIAARQTHSLRLRRINPERDMPVGLHFRRNELRRLRAASTAPGLPRRLRRSLRSNQRSGRDN